MIDFPLTMPAPDGALTMDFRHGGLSLPAVEELLHIIGDHGRVPVEFTELLIPTWVWSRIMAESWRMPPGTWDRTSYISALAGEEIHITLIDGFFLEPGPRAKEVDVIYGLGRPGVSRIPGDIPMGGWPQMTLFKVTGITSVRVR